MNISYSGVMNSDADRISPLDGLFGIDHAGSTFVLPEVPMDEDEIVVSVMVEGTTFVAVYGVVDGFVELISSDLGEGRAKLGSKPAHTVARNLLRRMARDEVLRTEIPFMPDCRLTPAKRLPGR